jgi:hypothetical protein
MSHFPTGILEDRNGDEIVVRFSRPDLERTFRELAGTWRDNTRFLSSVPDRVMHPAYQRIIGLGPAVVPLLLEDLERQPTHWFWALKAITGEDPVAREDAGAIRKMADAWLEWGRQRGYV